MMSGLHVLPRHLFDKIVKFHAKNCKKFKNKMEKMTNLYLLVFRCWTAVTLCYGSKQYFMFLSSGMHIFKHFYLLTLASRGTLPSVFGIKCKRCSAGTSIC